MNNLPLGFIMGFWVRAQDGNKKQVMDFTGQGPFFGVIRNRLTGQPLESTLPGPLVATEERATTNQWRLEFQLGNAPGLEGLLYLFASKEDATTYQSHCMKQWDQAALLPLLDQKLLPDVRQNQHAVIMQAMASQGTDLLVGATRQVFRSTARTTITLALNDTTVQMAAPGSPPEWIP